MSVTQEQTRLSKIRERGYWRVVIRPTFFEEKHIPEYSELFRIIEGKSVRLRVWNKASGRNPFTCRSRTRGLIVMSYRSRVSDRFKTERESEAACRRSSRLSESRTRPSSRAREPG